MGRTGLPDTPQYGDNAIESDEQERTPYINPEISDRLRDHVLRRVRQPEHRLGKNNPRYGQQYPCDQHEDKER